MINFRLVLEKHALDSLVKRLASAPNKIRKKGTKRIVKAGAKVYQRAAKQVAPRRFGALRQSLKVIAVKRPKTADAYVKVRPDPKTIRHLRERDESHSGSRASRLLKLAESRSIVEEEKEIERLNAVVGLSRARQRQLRRPRIKPAAYAHLTEVRNTTSLNWMRRNARSNESSATAAATREAVAVLKEAL